MELIMTGRNFSAQEAAQWGLVSKVVGDGEDEVVNEAVKTAGVIASKGRLATMAAKETIKAGESLVYEREIDSDAAISRRTLTNARHSIREAGLPLLVWQCESDRTVHAIIH